MITIFNGRSHQLGVGATESIYVQVSVSLREHLCRFPGSSLNVFLAIALHANEDGYAWPSIERLARETGLHRQTVFTALNQLEEHVRLPITQPDGNISEVPVLERMPQRLQDGKYQATMYRLFPTPSTKKPDTVTQPSPNFPYTEKPDTKKNHDSQQEPIYSSELSLAGNVTIQEPEQPDSGSLEGKIMEPIQQASLFPKQSHMARRVAKKGNVTTQPKPPSIHAQRMDAYVTTVTQAGHYANRRNAKTVLDELAQLDASPEEITASMVWRFEAWSPGHYHYAFEKVPDDVRSWRAAYSQPDAIDPPIESVLIPAPEDGDCDLFL